TAHMIIDALEMWNLFNGLLKGLIKFRFRQMLRPGVLSETIFRTTANVTRMPTRADPAISNRTRKFAEASTLRAGINELMISS
ncbi:hypothetical protein OAD24_15255, partial [Pseudomonadales bacterium]|nr:hypothetical protein [Pseudomonadales bacterium]